MERTCFFMGHSDAPNALCPHLEAAIERHILEYDVRCFIVGNYGNFDHMVQCALVQAKQHHPTLSLLLAIPYHPAIRSVPLPDGFSSTYFPEGLETVPYRAAIPRLNRLLVQQVDFLISYVHHISSGSYRVLNSARAREKRGQLKITQLPFITV